MRALRATGWDVVGVARRADRLQTLEAQTGAVAFAADLTRQEDVDALAAWLAETGPVHALVQVAGGARGTDRVEDADPADWQWMFDVNVLSAQRLVAALLPQLREAAASDGHADTALRHLDGRGDRVPRRCRATTPPRPPRRCWPTCCGWS